MAACQAAVSGVLMGSKQCRRPSLIWLSVSVMSRTRVKTRSVKLQTFWAAVVTRAVVGGLACLDSYFLAAALLPFLGLLAVGPEVPSSSGMHNPFRSHQKEAAKPQNDIQGLYTAEYKHIESQMSCKSSSCTELLTQALMLGCTPLPLAFSTEDTRN